MVRFYTYLQIFLSDLNRQATLSEFETSFNKPHQTVKSHLNVFVDAGILNEEKQKRLRIYRLNLTNPLTSEYLALCEKERLLNFLEKNILASRIYHEVSQFFSSSNFLLFGSIIDEKNYNDIDILAISKDKHIESALKKFEQTHSKKIHLLQTEKKHLTSAIIEEIKQKHIIFNNHDYFMDVLYR